MMILVRVLLEFVKVQGCVRGVWKEVRFLATEVLLVYKVSWACGVKTIRRSSIGRRGPRILPLHILGKGWERNNIPVLCLPRRILMESLLLIAACRCSYRFLFVVVAASESSPRTGKSS